MNLRKKTKFNELINYIEIERPKIRYPDRSATFLRNSHFLSQFDGNLFDLEEQQKEIAKAQLRETEIRNVVAQTLGTASLLRSDAAQEQNRRTTEEATRVRPRVRSQEGPRGRSTNPKLLISSNSTEPYEEQSGETRTGVPYSVNLYHLDKAMDDATDAAMEQADIPMSTIADTTMDKTADEAMEQADAVMEEAREKEEKKSKHIRNSLNTFR